MPLTVSGRPAPAKFVWTSSTTFIFEVSNSRWKSANVPPYKFRRLSIGQVFLIFKLKTPGSRRKDTVPSIKDRGGLSLRIRRAVRTVHKVSGQCLYARLSSLLGGSGQWTTGQSVAGANFAACLKVAYKFNFIIPDEVIDSLLENVAVRFCPAFLGKLRS